MVPFLDHGLILYHYSSCCCCSCWWGNLFKKALGSVISNRMEMKYGSIIPRANVHLLTEPKCCLFKMMAMMPFHEKNLLPSSQ